METCFKSVRVDQGINPHSWQIANCFPVAHQLPVCYTSRVRMLKRRTMIDLLLLLLAGTGFILWLMWNEPRLLYHPSREIEQTPDQLGLHYENINLTTSDGANINGWFLPGENLAEDGHVTRLTVLFFHGNAGNISHRLEKIGVFRDLGVDTFIIDYRGYGRSEGQPNEQGTYHDAQAAYEYLTQQRKLAPRSIVV